MPTMCAALACPTGQRDRPIATEIEVPAWRQTIFDPFAQMSSLARGEVSRAKVECETAAAYHHPYTVADALFRSHRRPI